MNISVFLMPLVCIFLLFSEVSWHGNIDLSFLYYVDIVPF